MMKRISVKIPESQLAELEKLVEKGEFASISEAVRTAIRLLLAKYHQGKAVEL